jgi:hypothetical protein
MMVIGKMIKLTDSESTVTWTVHAMRDSGKKINSTERALKLGQMEPAIKEIMLKEENMAMVNSHGLTEAHTLANSLKTI